MNKISETQLYVDLSLHPAVLELIVKHLSLKNTNDNTVADIFPTSGEFSYIVFLIVDANAILKTTASEGKSPTLYSSW